MNELPKLETLTQVFVFDSNINIRQKAFEIEEALKEFFPGDSIILPNPKVSQDDPHAERIRIANQKESFSATQERFTHTIAFKETLDLEKIFEAQLEQRKKILGLLKSFQINLQFSAYVAGFFREFNKESDLLELLGKNFPNSITEKPLSEFQTYYAIAFKEKYYLNVKFGKVTRFTKTIKLSNQLNAADSELSNISHGLELILDLNTRLSQHKGLNEQKSLTSELETDLFNLLRMNNLEMFMNGNIAS